jgi:hypothetical protein
LVELVLKNVLSVNVGASEEAHVFTNKGHPLLHINTKSTQREGVYEREVWRLGRDGRGFGQRTNLGN